MRLMRIMETQGDSCDSGKLMETHETQGDYCKLVRLSENNGNS